MTDCAAKQILAKSERIRYAKPGLLMSLCTRGPNLSRKAKSSTLHPFPRFDPCDTLLFFPNTFAVCLNSGDFDSLLHLVNTRATSTCSYYIVNMRFTQIGFLGALSILNELYPDGVLCVHSTRFVGNCLEAVMYYKCTDNKVITASMTPLLPDTRLFKCCSGPRADPKLMKSYISMIPAEDQERMERTISEAADVIVYGKALLQLTFDDLTKKISSIRVNYEFTSCCAAPEDWSEIV